MLRLDIIILSGVGINLRAFVGAAVIYKNGYYGVHKNGKPGLHLPMLD